MKLRLLAPNFRNAFSYGRAFSSHPPLQDTSTLSEVADELKSRPLNITYDYLSPTASHLLNVSLWDFLPSSCRPKFFKAAKTPLISSSRSSQTSNFLPPGHHIVYFPPPVTHNRLLPDGTDTLHSPATPTPFTRRLWAGGALTFNPSTSSHLNLNGGRVACIEGIRDVTIKGNEGDEKIFVHIERWVGYVNPDPDGRMRHEDEETCDEDVIKGIWEGNDAALVEKRNLVFLRGGNSTQVNWGKNDRVIKPFHVPDFSVALTPPPALLFRFSALTFNSHAIHLNPRYSRSVEGHRNLLDHGPLTLVLMLSVLHSQLQKGEMITSFTYRNLAPLYAQERMWVCLRRDRDDQKRWEVWIEGKSRGYAVRGSATIGNME